MKKSNTISLARWAVSIFALAFALASCRLFSSGAGTQGPDQPDLPPMPSNWEKLLDYSTLPILQNNSCGDAYAAWNYANVVLGTEVHIMDQRINSGDADEFATDPSLLDMPLTDSGWPTSLPEGYGVRVAGNYYRKADTPAGEYRSTEYQNITGVFVITWKGRTLPDQNGDQQMTMLDSTNDGHADYGTQFLPAGDHRVIAKVRSTVNGRGIIISYSHTDPSDPIRDIKMWAPVDDGAGLALDMSAYFPATMGPGKLSAYCTEPAPGQPDPIWHPKYLAHIASDPSGVLRFMGFLNINGLDGAPPLEWEDRTPASYTTIYLSGMDPFNYERHPLTRYKNRSGIPYEWLIDLCNRTGKDAWLQVPHVATQGHIAGLARLAAASLNSNRRLWFEFSNELWNNIGPYAPQYEAARAEGARYGQGQAWGSGYLQAWALQSFENAWRIAGGSDERLINVLGGFALSPGDNAQRIAGARAYSASAAELLAITTYFGAGITNELHTLPYGSGNPSNDVYERARESIRAAIYRDLEAWRGNGALCHDNNLGMIAYEGGSHLLAAGYGDWDNPDHVAFMRFLENLHKHPVMKELYLEHWALWSAMGGRTASLFVDISGYGYYGYWGAKEDVTETPDESPRWAASQEFEALQRGIRSMENPIGTRPLIQESRFFRGEAALPFSQPISASGGDGEINLVVLGGRLPSGVAFTSNPAIGSASLQFSGNPASSETARFVVRASDADGDPDYAIVTVAVDPEGTQAGRLVLFDPALLPAAGLERSENREDYRTRYDIARGPVTDESLLAARRHYLPFDPDAPLFAAHYGDSSVSLPASSAFAPSGAWALNYLVDEFNAANTTADNGAPVLWDPDRDEPVYFYGLYGKALSGWVGSSLRLSSADDRRFGVPTVFDGVMLWRKDQMDLTAGQTVSFGSGSQRASLILEHDGFGGDALSVRFVIRAVDGSGAAHYYLSEAECDEPFAGRFELVDFNDNSAAGKRWAEFSPSAGSFSLPAAASLSFNAVNFSNVDRVGFAFRSYRTGWHYGFAITRFLAVGQKN